MRLRSSERRKEGYQTRFFNDKRKAAGKKSRSLKPTTEKSVNEIIDMLGAQMHPDHYMHSPGDRYDLVKIKPVAVLGSQQRGLFAGDKGIQRGTMLGKYNGKTYTKKQFAKHTSTDKKATSHYAMQVTPDRIIDAVLYGNFSRFANFSACQDNVEFVKLDDGDVGLEAISDISPNMQLLVDYNGPHDPSAKVLFLNPEDGPETTEDIYMQHMQQDRNYCLRVSPEDYPSLYVSKGDLLYIHPLAINIIGNQKLTNHNPREIEQLCLKARADHMPKPAGRTAEEDPFTPLMLACYLGQKDNVSYLIQHGANVNRQQTVSGNCPLFLALDGYSKPEASQKDYFAIILTLLDNGARPTTYDTKYNTFLHKACLLLEQNDLQALVLKLKKKGLGIKQIVDYLNTDSEDVVMYCLVNKRFDNIAVLLKHYRDYFPALLDHRRVERSNPYTKQINSILQGYTDEDAYNFLSFLNDHIKFLCSPNLRKLKAKASNHEKLEGQLRPF